MEVNDQESYYESSEDFTIKTETISKQDVAEIIKENIIEEPQEIIKEDDNTNEESEEYDSEEGSSIGTNSKYGYNSSQEYGINPNYIMKTQNTNEDTQGIFFINFI